MQSDTTPIPDTVVGNAAEQVDQTISQPVPPVIVNPMEPTVFNEFTGIVIFPYKKDSSYNCKQPSEFDKTFIITWNGSGDVINAPAPATVEQVPQQTHSLNFNKITCDKSGEMVPGDKIQVSQLNADIIQFLLSVAMKDNLNDADATTRLVDQVSQFANGLREKYVTLVDVIPSPSPVQGTEPAPEQVEGPAQALVTAPETVKGPDLVSPQMGGISLSKTSSKKQTRRRWK